MRLPKRKSEALRQRDDDGPVLLTAAALKRLKQEYERLDTIDRPQAVEDLAEARQKGDLSENAEYQEARARLSRIQSRLFYMKERIKRASVIQKSSSGRIALGSTVVLRKDGKTLTYTLVGPHEANVFRGYISHLSPLGSALLGHSSGERITIHAENGPATYEILEVR